MMVTSRWLESLLSGCIVVGRRPVSSMADEMLCWPGATIELSEHPQTAADELEALLLRNDSLDAQRHTNMAEMLARHDWRYRIQAFCTLMKLPVPAKLLPDLAQLQALGASLPR